MQREYKMIDTRQSVLTLHKIQGHGEKWSSEQYKHWEILVGKISHFCPNSNDKLSFFFAIMVFHVKLVATVIIGYNHLIFDEFLRYDSSPFVETLFLSILYCFKVSKDFRICFY